MNKELINKIWPHALAIAFFVALSLVYFSPQLQGKKLNQHDVISWKGASQEVNNYKAETGEISLWTNSMFGGMPTYLINIPADKNIIARLVKYAHLGLSRPASHLFMYLLGFYLCMLAFKQKIWLAIAGAVAYAFSSYLFIIIAAGHITKILALGYMPAIIGGVYMSFTDKKLKGAAVIGLFLSFQILTNHIQIVYYTFLTILIFGIFWLYQAIKNNQITNFFKSVGFAALGVILAIGVNITILYLTYDYGKDSLRGKSELTHDIDNQTTGLDKDYATAWSYGIGETFTLLIPNFKGGASGGALSEKSETYKLYANAQGKAAAKRAIKQQPTYWGTQPFTSGPVYIGAIICFLFVLGLILVKGPIKWWIVAATLLSILLAWGHNFMWFTNLFLDYFPGYNKFRTVSMILVIAGFTMPLLAILGISKIFNGETGPKQFKKAIAWSVAITAGLSLIFALFPGMFSYTAPSDERYLAQGYDIIVDALKIDRQTLLRNDAFRSFIFIIIAAALLIASQTKKISRNIFFPALILLILIDMWPVNRRYLNSDNFTSKKQVEQTFDPTNADKFILKDTDPDYRVLNLTTSTFNDGQTSYFHKSIGGYHGAKMRRYQELIDFHISNEIQSVISVLQNPESQNNIYNVLANQKVLNMLNTKYIIYNPESYPLVNISANGHAWFVNNITFVNNADAEIAELKNIDTKTTAVVDNRFANLVTNTKPQPDSTAQIKLDVYKPNYLKYSTKTSTNQVAVFSEIYYNKGWQVTIDGLKADHFRANYVLRAMNIPQGEHTIEFTFAPKAYNVGNTISIISSILLLLLLAGAFLKPLIIKNNEKKIE